MDTKTEGEQTNTEKTTVQAKKMIVKVRFVTFGITENSWESSVVSKNEITFEWLKYLFQEKMAKIGVSDGNDPSEIEIFILDKSGDWIKISTEADLTMELMELPNESTVKFMLKKTFPNVKWDTIEATLGALSENPEARSAIVSVAKGMLADPAAHAYLNTMAQQLFSNSILLSGALKEAVNSLNGLPEDGLKPAEQPKETKKSDSDKTLKEILMEMDGFKEPPPKMETSSGSLASSSPSALQTASLSSSSSTSSSSKQQKTHQVPNYPPPSKGSAGTGPQKKESGKKQEDKEDGSNPSTQQQQQQQQSDDKGTSAVPVLTSSSEGGASVEGGTIVNTPPEEKKFSTKFFDFFKKGPKESDILKCREELEKNNIDCSDDEIKSALSHCKTPEKAVCLLTQKSGGKS